MAHLDGLLSVQAILEIENYIQYRKEKTPKKLNFNRTRDFLKKFEEEFNKDDLLFEQILWEALKKTTTAEMRTTKDLRQVWSSYQPDFMLLVNSDSSLLGYGADRLPLERVQELSKLIITISEEFLHYGPYDAVRRYVA